MERPLERRVEGTYRTADEAREAVRRLLDEGYQTEEILLITDEDSDYERELKNLQVDVDSVDADEGDSFWERIVEAFTFDDDDEEDNSSLEEYGVREENAERFNEALQANEIVLLVDSAAPRENGSLSEVNEEVLESDAQIDNRETLNSDTTQSVVFHESSDLNENIRNQGGVNHMANTDKERNQNIDEVASNEAEAVKNKEKQKHEEKKPSDVSTSETSAQAMGDNVDPSQAQETRKDGEVEEKTDSQQSKPDQSVTSGEPGEFDAESTEDEGDSLQTTPELTGDEDTVEKEPSDHRYQDNIAKGTVDGKNNK